MGNKENEKGEHGDYHNDNFKGKHRHNQFVDVCVTVHHFSTTT